jgi:Family of unknown function (DUF6455)
MAISAKSQSQPIYLQEMMGRLGIDADAGVVAQSSLSCMTALHRCQACTHQQECRRWLDAMPASVALPPRFCPNADIFFEMQVNQPGPHYGDKSARMAIRLGGI